VDIVQITGKLWHADCCPAVMLHQDSVQQTMCVIQKPAATWIHHSSLANSLGVFSTQTKQSNTNVADLQSQIDAAQSQHHSQTHAAMMH